VHAEIENVSDVQLTELSLQQQMDNAIQLSMISHQTVRSSEVSIDKSLEAAIKTEMALFDVSI